MLTGCNPQFIRSLPHQKPSMIPTDGTAFRMAIIAITRLEDLFTLCWTFFTFALFTFALLIVTASVIAVILAMVALVRYKRRGTFPSFRDRRQELQDRRQELQHRRRHTRTRAKSCPKQCCYKPQVMQPPATLGMWK